MSYLQNKVAKIMLDKRLYSSASEALATLNWITLEQIRVYRGCLYVFKSINGYTNHSMELEMYTTIIFEIRIN